VRFLSSVVTVHLVLVRVLLSCSPELLPSLPPRVNPRKRLHEARNQKINFYYNCMISQLAIGSLHCVLVGRGGVGAAEL